MLIGGSVWATGQLAPLPADQAHRPCLRQRQPSSQRISRSVADRHHGILRCTVQQLPPAASRCVTRLTDTAANQADRQRIALAFVVRSRSRGARGCRCHTCRAAIAPFLANATLGSDSFSWILYGDDDTFFNVDAALRMVNALNHTQPYLLTDNVWFPAADGARSGSS